MMYARAKGFISAPLKSPGVYLYPRPRAALLSLALLSLPVGVFFLGLVKLISGAVYIQSSSDGAVLGAS